MPKLKIAPGELVTLARGDDVIVTVFVESGTVEWVPDDGAQADRIAPVLRGVRQQLGAGPIHLCNVGDLDAIIDVERSSSWIAWCENTDAHDDVWRWGPGSRQGAKQAGLAHAPPGSPCVGHVEGRRVG